ncbi:MAG: hypothetical protein AVDCRST_MAG18-1463, partial [uncultured Thermomicrobiales bacterium]
VRADTDHRLVGICPVRRRDLRDCLSGQGLRTRRRRGAPEHCRSRHGAETGRRSARPSAPAIVGGADRRSRRL